ncbi:MAG TPA: flagellar motor protein MotB [Bryobacteraceae bacterium]|nr:flagellar motor protein MotB [Bryobacteraceae bacterium]
MEQAPIIVIKRKKHAHGHHGGAWKVAYADFVTAMMALFIVLWLLSSSEQVQKAVGGYFTDPTGSGKELGNGLRGIGGESLTVTKMDMAKLKDRLDQAVKQTAPLQKIKEHVVMTVTGEGLRVELTEGQQAGFFFQSGSPDPSGVGKDMLSTLAAEIGKLPNTVIIEGHTDNKALAKKDYTNWELSTDRANTARRWMEQNGMRPDQVVQVRGFADQKPRDATNPDDPSNRRITVIIQNPENQTGFGAAGATGAKAGTGAAAPAAEAPKPSPVPARK